jgi:hypothetical protein
MNFVEIIRSPADDELMVAFAGRDKRAYLYCTAERMEELLANPAQEKITKDILRKSLALLDAAKDDVASGRKSLTEDFRGKRDVEPFGILRAPTCVNECVS